MCRIEFEIIGRGKANETISTQRVHFWRKIVYSFSARNIACSSIQFERTERGKSLVVTTIGLVHSWKSTLEISKDYKNVVYGTGKMCNSSIE